MLVLTLLSNDTRSKILHQFFCNVLYYTEVYSIPWHSIALLHSIVLHCKELPHMKNVKTEFEPFLPLLFFFLGWFPTIIWLPLLTILSLTHLWIFCKYQKHWLAFVASDLLKVEQVERNSLFKWNLFFNAALHSVDHVRVASPLVAREYKWKPPTNLNVLPNPVIFSRNVHVVSLVQSSPALSLSLSLSFCHTTHAPNELSSAWQERTKLSPMSIMPCKYKYQLQQSVWFQQKNVK